MRRLGSQRRAFRTRRTGSVESGLLPVQRRGRGEQAIMEPLNRSGDWFLTHTKVNGKLTLRVCVGQTNTQARHVEKAWNRFQEEGPEIAVAVWSGDHVASNSSASDSLSATGAMK
jgi:hypothetical protein